MVPATPCTRTSLNAVRSDGCNGASFARGMAAKCKCVYVEAPDFAQPSLHTQGSDPCKAPKCGPVLP